VLATSSTTPRFQLGDAGLPKCLLEVLTGPTSMAVWLSCSTMAGFIHRLRRGRRGGVSGGGDGLEDKKTKKLAAFWLQKRLVVLPKEAMADGEVRWNFEAGCRGRTAAAVAAAGADTPISRVPSGDPNRPPSPRFGAVCQPPPPAQCPSPAVRWEKKRFAGIT